MPRALPLLRAVLLAAVIAGPLLASRAVAAPSDATLRAVPAWPPAVYAVIDGRHGPAFKTNAPVDGHGGAGLPAEAAPAAPLYRFSPTAPGEPARRIAARARHVPLFPTGPPGQP
jgi:hypothetical protein